MSAPVGHVIKIGPDGSVLCLYTEGFDLGVFGSTPEIQRASDVLFDRDLGGWVVDLLNGERLEGPEGRGWAKRSEAIAAEVTYLQERL